MDRKQYKRIREHSSAVLLPQLVDCDSFSLVQGLVPRGEVVAPPTLKKALQPYLLAQSRSCNWPGTEMQPDEDWEEAIIHRYCVCPESLAILARYPTLLSYEEDMDIWFEKDGVIVLYTTAHEGNVWRKKP